MNPKRHLRIALGALAATIAVLTANADGPTDTPQLIQPVFDRLIPSTYPLSQPNYSKLKTADSSQLIQPGFERLIPTTYPLILPNVSRLKVTGYEVITPGSPQLHAETKSLHPKTTAVHVTIHSGM